MAGAMADGTLKIRVAAPPERGQANAELVRFLAGYYGVAAESVSILSGHAAARKLVRLPGGA